MDLQWNPQSTINFDHLDMSQANISCDHRCMLALCKAFELVHKLPDVLRLDHPDQVIAKLCDLPNFVLYIFVNQPPDCQISVAVRLEAACHLDGLIMVVLMMREELYLNYRDVLLNATSVII